MNLFRTLGKALRPRSLRVQLVLPFVLVILLLTLALGWLFWWAGSRSVADLTGQLMVERTERMAEAVGRHMFGAAAVLETAFPRGMRGLNDVRPAQRALATRFYTAASLHPEPSDLVYYANENGQGYALQRLVDGSAQVRLQDGEGGARKIFMLYDIEGTPEYRFTESRLFDPRERLWYQVGKTASEHRWTGVYLDFDSGELVNSRVRQVLDGDGRQVGVVGTDILLFGLSRFIAGLDISKNSRAFIVEPDGQLVALSAGRHVRRDGDGNYRRVNADDSGEPLLEQAWQHVRDHLPDLSASDQGVHALSFIDERGQQVLVSVRHILDAAGLDWYAIIAVPASDILADVRHKVILVMYCGVLAILLAALLGMLVLGRVADDVEQLSTVVGGAAGRGMQTLYPQVRRRDEIGTLARSFRKMHRELLTDRLTGVASRAALEHALNRLQQQRRKSGQPFTVLFIDLNRFKPLNDRFGHETGDRALTEVAGRMQQMLRDQDMLARWGGDEFVILLPDVADRDTGERVSQRVQQAISQPLDCCEGYRLGAAIGMALYPEDGRDAVSLLHAADQAMYADKPLTMGER